MILIHRLYRGSINPSLAACLLEKISTPLDYILTALVLASTPLEYILISLVYILTPFNHTSTALVYVLTALE